MKKVLVVSVAGLLLTLISASALAQDTAGQEQAAPPVEEQQEFTWAHSLAIIGACFGAAVATAAGGVGIARVGSACMDAMARQPEAAGSMFAPMIVTAAMIEGGMLFAIVVCLMGVLFK